MTRPLTLAAYRDLLADVAGRHGGVVDGGCIEWRAPDGTRIAELWTTTSGNRARHVLMRAGSTIRLSDDPAAALRDLDAARAILERAIAARDELAGVVVDVSTRSPE